MPELLELLGTVDLLGLEVPTTVAVVVAVVVLAALWYAGMAFLSWLQGIVVWLVFRHTVLFLITSTGIGLGTILELTQEAGLLGTLRNLAGGIPLVGGLLQQLLPATLQLLTISV